jgi:hypothetical protein
MGRAFVHTGNEEYTTYFERKIQGKTPIGRPRRRWEDDIKTGLREMRCEI